MNKSYKIIYVVNVDWFFLSHRLPIAKKAMENGAEVFIVTSNTGLRNKLESYGFKVIDISFSRSGTNIFFEIFTVIRLLGIYRNIKPDLVHHVTIKPVLYGSMVARFIKNIAVVNAITGMGFAFSDDHKAARIKNLVKYAYRIYQNKKNVRVIFQNEEDKKYFIQKRLTKSSQAKLIKGSGVDCDKFKPLARPVDAHDQIILLASRMIWDKGIREFYEAAKIIKASNPETRFVLVGKTDRGNPNFVPASIIRKWEEDGIIEWWGYRESIRDILQRCAIVTLPTFYPEGVPKILIEAASTGKPIIASDRPGCRDIVKNGENGILIPEKNSRALADAIWHLLSNPEKMKRFGQRGRQIALSEFSEKKVVEETMKIYDELLGINWRKKDTASGLLGVE